MVGASAVSGSNSCSLRLNVARESVVSCFCFCSLRLNVTSESVVSSSGVCSLQLNVAREFIASFRGVLDPSLGLFAPGASLVFEGSSAGPWDGFDGASTVSTS